MKRILTEKLNQNIVQAPKNELQLLNQDIFKGNGRRIVNLEVDPNGYPKVITVGGKSYVAAVLTPKGNYIVYDGRILKKTDGRFSYMTIKDPKTNRNVIAVVRGVPDANLQDIFNEKLVEFGLDKKQDVYYYLSEIKNKLQPLIDSGALSERFRKFNETLTYFYPNDDTQRLNFAQGKTSFEPPIDTEELYTNFREYDLQRYGIPGKFFYPKKSGADLLSADQGGVDITKCKKYLTDYLVFAAMSMGTGETLLSPSQMSEFRRQIKYCQGRGAYRDDFSLSNDELSGFTIDKRYDPFLRQSRLGFSLPNKNLSFKEIKNYLNDLGRQKGYKSGGWALIENKLKKENIIMETTPNQIITKRNKIKDDKELSTIVKTKLLEEFERKKKLISEQEIIRKRLSNIIGENTEISKLSKKEKERLSKKFIVEIHYLHQQNLINEAFLEFVKGIFGGIFPGVLDSIVEPYVDSLLKGLGLGGYWKNFFVSLFTSNPMTLINALKSCDAMTKLVSEALVEGMVMNLQEKTGTKGTTGIVIRNIMGQALKNQAFIEGLSKSLRDPVCDLYESMTDKAKNVLDKLKSDKEENLTPQLQN